METGGERLHGTLEGYGRFLTEKDLSSQKERHYVVRGVIGFPLFARAYGGVAFEQTLDLLLAQVGERIRVPDILAACRLCVSAGWTFCRPPF